MMSYRSSWHKAIALSIFLHIFLWVTTGYLAFRVQDPPPANEEVIELSLIDAPGDDIAEEEPQLASLPLVPEVPPEPDPPLEPNPLVVSDDMAEKIVEPIKTMEEKEITATLDKVNIGGKKSGKGTPPIVLVRVDPVNPPEMEEIGRKVVVVLRMQILANGLPGKVTIAVPSGYKSINDAAIAAAKKWKFEPAKDREGRPMVCLTILSIPFVLN